MNDRKRRGAWFTPPELVAPLVKALIDRSLVERLGTHRPVLVVDLACGDGRLLHAARDRIEMLGGTAALTGVDIDAPSIDAARSALGGDATLILDDALTLDWGDRRFDVVIGNPPFLSQMATSTTRGGASPHGGGPYAGSAVEFLALASRVVRADGGRVGLVLPQSVLASRHAASVRDDVDGRATMVWSAWSDDRFFDASVVTCSLVFEFGVASSPGRSWSDVVVSRADVPTLPDLAVDGTLADRAKLNANFRDEYYGLVPAVDDHADGPPLITSGLIDPGRNWWGARPVTFNRRKLMAPRVDCDRLDPRMRQWAASRLVPKVLVANQTSIIEAVADPLGEWLPGVPVVAVYPTATTGAVDAWQIAAVLTSPTTSAWIWHVAAGTGLSASAVRVGPAVLGSVPWPKGELGGAVAALRAGDVRRCGALVDAAFGVDDAGDVAAWWHMALDRIDRRTVRQGSVMRD